MARETNTGRSAGAQKPDANPTQRRDDGTRAQLIELLINGSSQRLDLEPEMPLLWVLRDELGLTGTKFGCGIGQCGACTVAIDGVPVRSCSLPVGAVSGPITTIERLGGPERPHPVQQAWIDSQAAQCGYCQPGQILAASCLLAKSPNPTDAEIDAAMTGLCRCGTYPRLRDAIRRAAAALNASA
jgi:isoquinoline 1-oxidoreductase alpha subunit